MKSYRVIIVHHLYETRATIHARSHEEAEAQALLALNISREDVREVITEEKRS